MVVVGPAGGEEVFGDSAAIEVDVDVAEGGKEGDGAFDGLVEGEVFAVDGGGGADDFGDGAPGLDAVFADDAGGFAVLVFPGVIGDPFLGGAVLILNREFGDESGGVAVVDGFDFEGGFAGFEEVGEVDGLGAFPGVGAIVGTDEEFAVEVGDELVVGGDDEGGANGEVFGDEGLGEGRAVVARIGPDPGGSFEGFGGIEGGDVGDPGGFPVGFVKESGRECCGVAVGGCVIVLIPDLNFPEGLLIGGEGSALVVDVVGVVGGDAAAVPEVAVVLVELFAAGGDEDAVGGLFEVLEIVVGGFELPGEVGDGAVDSDGFDHGLGAQVGGGHGGSGSGEGRC